MTRSSTFVLAAILLSGCAPLASAEGAEDDASRSDPAQDGATAEVGNVPEPDAGAVSDSSSPATDIDALPPAPTPGRWTGVNWFGLETGNLAPHGLWARDYKSVLQQIRDLGFNSVRIPWCNSILTGTPTGIQINEYGVDAYSKAKGINTELAGLTSVQVLDKLVEHAAKVGLKIILDNHSREPDGYMNETLWYTAKVPEEKWIADWKVVAARYAKYPNVVAADLDNEPHGNTGMGMKPPAAWGNDIPGFANNDWRAAAEKCGVEVLKVNPNLMIIVEGVEQYKGETYWWGGNLAGVRDAPITLIPKDRLIYSPHEYGPEVYAQPWFSEATFPGNMPAIWDKHFGFIQKEGSPLFFGEFGIKESSAADPSSAPHKWLKAFLEYAGKSSSWTFWALNPNSGDTGGLLQDDWVTVNAAKYGMLKPYLEPIP